ncbi:unnamed protein product, partial [Mesorhabditis belari]|uniref:YhhN-like protein n=1 Tax=Mesorhabditis belari TaxID=2138241 RepID=A0AAF3EET6_9BILA
MSSSPARGLAIYGGTAFLVYLETHGFRSPSPFFGSLPYIVLPILTISTNINNRVKYPMAGSFIALAFGNYFFEAHLYFGVAAFLLMISHVLYILSLLPHLKEWSVPLLLLSTVAFVLTFAWLFSDVFISIPFLVLILSSLLISSLVLTALAGSLLHYGGKGEMDDSKTLSLIRLIGSLCAVVADVLYICNLFGRRDPMIFVLRKALMYLGQGFMYLASERAF